MEEGVDFGFLFKIFLKLLRPSKMHSYLNVLFALTFRFYNIYST